MAFTFTLLLLFVVVRYILPRVLRMLLGSFVRQQMHKAQQAGGFPPGYGPDAGPQRPAPGPPPTAPGQVRIDYVPPQPREARHGEFKGGEYTDYEEVR